MRISRTGALATFDAESRLPLATLVGVASDWDGAPLLLMSELARHTRNLAQDSRASLLLMTQGGRGDPLNQPRLTVGGPVERCPDPTSLARYLQRYPKAKLYANFADFALRRMRIETVHFNGGFGRADVLKPEDLLTPPSDSVRTDRGRTKSLGAHRGTGRDGADASGGWRRPRSAGRGVL